MKKTISKLTALLVVTSLTPTVISCQKLDGETKLIGSTWLNNNEQLQNIELFFNNTSDILDNKVQILDNSNPKIKIAPINYFRTGGAELTVILFDKENNNYKEGTRVPAGDTLKIIYNNNSNSILAWSTSNI